MDLVNLVDRLLRLCLKFRWNQKSLKFLKFHWILYYLAVPEVLVVPVDR